MDARLRFGWGSGLWESAQTGDVGRVQQGLQAGMPVPTFSDEDEYRECVWRAMSVAAYNDRADCVALLLRAVPPPTGHSMGLCVGYFGRVARAGFVDVVEAMMSTVDVNEIVDAAEATALHVAGTPDAVRALVEARASCAARTLFFDTPLMTAASRGDAAVVAALVAAKSDVNDVGRTRTALIAAAGAGRRLDAVAVLLQAKADVHMPARLGRTCLHAAVHHQNAGLVDVLVAAKVDVNAACTPITDETILGPRRNILYTPMDVCYDMAAKRGRVFVEPIYLKLLAVKATTMNPRCGLFHKDLGWVAFEGAGYAQSIRLPRSRHLLT